MHINFTLKISFSPPLSYCSDNDTGLIGHSPVGSGGTGGGCRGGAAEGRVARLRRRQSQDGAPLVRPLPLAQRQTVLQQIRAFQL